MVKKYDLWGNAYHEPPYTEAEQDEMYRRMSTIVSFTRPQATLGTEKNSQDEDTKSNTKK